MPPSQPLHDRAKPSLHCNFPDAQPSTNATDGTFTFFFGNPANGAKIQVKARTHMERHPTQVEREPI